MVGVGRQVCRRARRKMFRWRAVCSEAGARRRAQHTARQEVKAEDAHGGGAQKGG